MIKLTPEQVDSVVEKFAGGAEWTDTDYINAVTFARAIEAEVLRLNGDAVEAEREACAALCDRLAYEDSTCRGDMPDLYQFGEAIRARRAVPRATGCPDTMDDTGHFAEVDMPAFLRKQNPA